jgi:hypothetical protein
MKYYYFLVSHDFKQKQSTIIQNCNKYDGLHMIESLCEEYIKQMIGNKPIKYYCEGDSNRDYGYFIEKSKYDLNKLTVKHKYIKSRGFFINDVVIEDIISYKLAFCEKESDDDLYEFECNNNFVEVDKYNKVVDMIKTTIKLIDE